MLMTLESCVIPLDVGIPQNVWKVHLLTHNGYVQEI